MNITKSLITSSINRYRECVRSIWNTYFMEQYQSTQNWDLLDSFEKIKQELFNSIVLTPALADDEIFDYTLGFSCPRIKIIPSQISNRGDKWDIPVEINRNKGEISGYWDYPIKRISAPAEILFVNFFDWNRYGFIDMSRIMAEIYDYPENPSIIGHRLIVDLMYVDIILQPSSP